MILFYLILTVILPTTVVVVYNYFSAPVLKYSPTEKKTNDLISVLIPARNEEQNIEKCLRSVLNQTFNNLEVIVLDDESVDSTYKIAKRFEAIDKRITAIKGELLPASFTGKNWACHQLSAIAKGEYLLFMDCDVELERNAISIAINEMKNTNLKLLSVFPTQKILSFGEWLIVPLMNWILLTFLPLKFINSTDSKYLTAANGQFLLFKSDTYKAIGGHQFLSNSVVEDMEFARKLKKERYKIKTYLGGNMVYCRMYNDFDSSFKGFSKNFYPGFNISPVAFLFLIICLVICFLLPFYLIIYNNIFTSTIILILAQRIVISKKSKQNILINFLLHPFQIIFVFILGINSIIVTKTKNRIWKGRRF